MYKQYSSLHSLFTHTSPEDANNPNTITDSMLSSTGSLSTRNPPPNTPENEFEHNNTNNHPSIDTLIEPLSAALTSSMPSDNSPPDTAKSATSLFGFIPVKLGSPRAPPPDAEKNTQDPAEEEGEGETSLVSSTGSWVQVQSISETSKPIERISSSSVEVYVPASQDTEKASLLQPDWFNNLQERLERIESTQSSHGKNLFELNQLITTPTKTNNKPLTKEEQDPTQERFSKEKSDHFLQHETYDPKSPSSKEETTIPNSKKESPQNTTTPSPPPPYKIANPNSVPTTPPFPTNLPLLNLPHPPQIPSSLNLSPPEKKAPSTTTAINLQKVKAERCADYLKGLQKRERERDDGSGRILKADVYEGGPRGRFGDVKIVKIKKMGESEEGMVVDENRLRELGAGVVGIGWRVGNGIVGVEMGDSQSGEGSGRLGQRSESECGTESETENEKSERIYKESCSGFWA
ncbi:MAG: hypothetical protein M1812_003208 [Candelaria pacifica]|nr:MAG: hypothetical protein M1812_003208 [Candelaria pacifica]